MEPGLTRNPSPVTEVKQFSFLVTLLSVLLLISVFIAGFFAYQTQKLVNELRVMSDELKPTPVATQTPDPTADWETYIDSEYSFSFKYPIEWSAPNELSKNINFDDKLIITKGPFYDLVLKRNLSFDEYVIRSYGDETPRNDFDLNNLVGKRGIEKAVSNYRDIVILAKDSKTADIVSLSYFYDPLSEDNNIFDQILSTFKFIEKQTPIGTGIEIGISCQQNGKIYKNGESVPSGDSCNFCSCENGQVACTLIACQ